jgi:plasmid rolling circle replication initiator protein Rep
MENKLGKNDINDDFKVSAKIGKNDKSILLKRARAKYFTLGLMMKMVDLGSELKKSYWNTYYCATTMKQEANKITTKYCKNRFCIVCNRIRTAINILKYYGEIESWEEDERYFVTLTFPNVKDDVLLDTIDDMFKNFSQIMDVAKKRKVKLIGIRKLEVTYNPERNDYHPHFHLICRGKEVAEMLRTEWLKRYSGAEKYCQDIRKADKGAVMELFKYFTKIITSKSGEKHDSEKAPIEFRRKIYVNALDNIFCSIRGRRTFQNFGFKAKNIDEEKIETVEVDKICNEIQYFNWERELHDWINADTGECLTGYKPSEAMKKLVNEDIVMNELKIREDIPNGDEIAQRFYDVNSCSIRNNLLKDRNKVIKVNGNSFLGKEKVKKKEKLIKICLCEKSEMFINTTGAT